MDNQKQELITKLSEANNILVTVSSNPSVDQLAACIGLTLLMNKLNKHATAVFSGQVPSTLQFLKPEETLEKNTDSLRDFIVSLDKAKADKLRYKVEDNVVKIFITPYKTSITQADLDFSQGDFNIDVVVCLGVEKQQDLDQAIVSHGRILHDATVISISAGAATELGTLNWVEPQASSLSELTAQIADSLGREQMDGQIATAFLTGIVAETDRFSNEKTSPVTMQLSAQLMAAGANQQLVASELKAGTTSLAINAPTADSTSPPSGDGTLEIGHDSDESDADADSSKDDDEQPSDDNPNQPGPPTDDGGSDGSDQPPPSDEPAAGDDPNPPNTDEQPPAGPGEQPASRLVMQPPSMGGTLTANSAPESFDPSVDPLTLLNSDAPMLNREPAPRNDTSSPADNAATPTADDLIQTSNIELPEVNPLPQTDNPLESSDSLPEFEALPSEPQATNPPLAPAEAPEKSLVELEESVDSPHLHADEATATVPAESLDAARDAVMAAVNSAPPTGPLPPTQAAGATGYLNVQDLPDATDNQVPVKPQDLTIPSPDPTPPTSVAEPASTAPPVPPPLPLDDLAKLAEPPK